MTPPLTTDILLILGTKCISCYCEWSGMRENMPPPFVCTGASEPRGTHSHACTVIDPRRRCTVVSISVTQSAAPRVLLFSVLTTF